MQSELLHFTSVKGDQFSIVKDWIGGFTSFSNGDERVFSIMLRSGDEIDVDEIEYNNIRNFFMPRRRFETVEPTNLKGK